MGIDPIQDLRNPQGRYTLRVSYAPRFGQDLSQGRTGVEPSETQAQTSVDRRPVFVAVVKHTARGLMRPLSRSGVMVISPGQDLIDSQVDGATPPQAARPARPESSGVGLSDSFHESN